MGQKVNPNGFRLGIIRDWDSRWYDAGANIAEKIKEDRLIREYVITRLKRQKAGVSKVIIERTTKNIKLYIYAARPGAVVGKSGEEINTLGQELGRLTKKEVKIDVIEIKKPELDAQLVADNIAAQLEGRVSFRRAMKQAMQQANRAGAEGVRIQVSGRLGGAEIARMEQYREGKVPLHTLRADIDYAQSTAFTITGTVGVKVWIYKGEMLEKRIDTIEEEERQKVKDRRENQRNRGGRGDSRKDARGESRRRRRKPSAKSQPSDANPSSSQESAQQANNAG
ncbi:MAG: 30S ribosomal protein S3 [Chloroherpetonaceae bacterium]